MKSILNILLAGTLLIASLCLVNAQNRNQSRTDLFSHLQHPFENPTGDPDLPRVLLIGDSISIGYTIPVRRYLLEKANVHRPPTNCQDSGYGLQNIRTWLGNGSWDVIHFNWGIWDTHWLDENGEIVAETQGASGPMRIRHTLEQYRENLTHLVNVLRSTDAKLIWASSTPIMSRKGERFEDIEARNRVAEEIMRPRGIEINDLYEFV